MASGFGDRVAMALGCHGLSPHCLPAAPALWPDPRGFPVSHSDPAGKGRDRAMRMGSAAHGGPYPTPVGQSGARASQVEEVPSCPKE